MKIANYTCTAFSLLFLFCTIQWSVVNALPYAKPSATATPTAPASQPAPVTVKIENFAFIPKELTITAGTTVTWRNADDVPHTATSKDDPQVFDSGPLDTDEKFSFTFSKPGKYTYYCKVHPHMTGVVTVK